MRSFLSDLQLLLDNACAFYSQGSEEYRSALTLKSVLMQKLEELSGRASEGREGGREEREQQTGLHPISVPIKARVGVWVRVCFL